MAEGVDFPGKQCSHLVLVARDKDARRRTVSPSSRNRPSFSAAGDHHYRPGWPPRSSLAGLLPSEQVSLTDATLAFLNNLNGELWQLLRNGRKMDVAVLLDPPRKIRPNTIQYWTRISVEHFFDAGKAPRKPATP